MLLGKVAPSEPPDASHNLSRAPTPLEPREGSARRTQPADADVDAGLNPSIPTRLHDNRVPSSESPSPMRMPGICSPSTPKKVPHQAAMGLHENITSSLGKRPADSFAREREQDDDVRRLRDAPLGKRARPLNRSRVRHSLYHITQDRADHLDGISVQFVGRIADPWPFDSGVEPRPCSPFTSCFDHSRPPSSLRA